MTLFLKHALTFLSLIVVFFFCICTDKMAGAGSETTNGITGRVVNKDGSVAAQITVRLFPAEFDPLSGDTTIDILTTNTDEHGLFRFEDILPGDYSLIIRNQDKSLCARVSDIKINSTDSLVRLTDCSLDTPGSLVMDFSISANSITGYCYIPGTDIYSFADSNYIVHLQGVPAGLLDSIVFASTGDSSKLVVIRSILLQPSQQLKITNPQWRYSRIIGFNTSVSGADVDSDLFDVAVLLRLNGDNFNFSQAQVSGEDLLFTTNNNKMVAFEVERWDAKAQKAEIWLHIDTLLGKSSSQIIMMYWGNESKHPVQRDHIVFDTALGFEGVWHLGEAGNDSTMDATVNHYCGISPDSAVPLSVAGVIGNARNFDGVRSFIEIPNSANSRINFAQNDNYTISAWVYVQAPDDLSHVIVSKGNAQYFLWYTSIHLTATLWEFADYRSETGWDLATAKISSGEWVFVTGVHDGNAHALYINGERLDTLINYPFNVTRNDQSDLMIGRFSQKMASPTNDEGYCYFNGIIDEVQISSVARSAQWIRLAYQNQRINDKLISFH